MIKYNTGSFGFGLLFRLHGSAVFRSFVPSVISSFIYILLFHTTDLEDPDEQLLLHPYAIGALISALTFLLAFRANFAYARYWEAVSSLHQMHSKWLDAAMDLAAFHLQSARYEAKRPPAFGEHPDLTDLHRFREREYETTLEDLQEQLDNNPEMASLSFRSRIQRTFFRRRKKNRGNHHHNSTLSEQERARQAILARPKSQKRKKYKSINKAPSKTSATFTSVFASVFTSRIKQPAPSPPVDSNKNLVVRTDSQRMDDEDSNDLPSLFLQEAAHLMSLLSAVAMSTLRNDMEQADSPLSTFIPGVPWPHVDPDSYGADVRQDWAATTHRSVTVIRYLLGFTRSPADRTLYNAARPFRVIGGVSDAEVELLAAARGPSAKVALAFMWVEEFVSREHLNGSTGKIAAPIISRLFQFLSDGMIGYNQARKVAYIPFPFPHSQITSLFVLVVVGLMPVLMLSFLTNEVFGFVMNLLTVMIFTGLHEVARELESPFFNAPNDLPLNNWQAQYNEALLVLFAGYHPDAFWSVYEATEEEIEAANKAGKVGEVIHEAVEEGDEQDNEESHEDGKQVATEINEPVQTEPATENDESR